MRWTVLAGALLLKVMMSLLRPVSALLNFQHSTDILGFASTFEEGDGLPTRNFTMAFTVQSSCGRIRYQIALDTVETFYFYMDPSARWADVGFASKSHIFPFGNHSVEELFMHMRTWSITYDDSRKKLSLYADGWCLGSIDSDLFGDGENGDGETAIFGPNGVAQIFFGPYGFYIDGVLTAATADWGLYGLFDSFQLWDRALNSTEVAQLAASPHSLTGDDGLAIWWQCDRGHGSWIQNFGRTGSKYDGVLGRYASGVEETSAVLGVGCDALVVTSPTWVNHTGAANSPPVAEDQFDIPVRSETTQEMQTICKALQYA